MISSDTAKSGLLDPVEEGRYIIRTDPHCHILPGVDDGAPDLKSSLQMARRAASCGIQTIVATPHGCHPAVPHGLLPDDLRQHVFELNQAIATAGIPVTVLPGTEIFLSAEALEEYEAGHLLSWADQGRYALMELGFRNCTPVLWEAIDYFSAKGVVPIIAHPERYLWLPNETQVIEKLAERGCIFQLNMMSLSGLLGAQMQELAFHVMRTAPSWLIGTDSHSSADKYFGIEAVRQTLEDMGLWRHPAQPAIRAIR